MITWECRTRKNASVVDLPQHYAYLTLLMTNGRKRLQRAGSFSILREDFILERCQGSVIGAVVQIR